MKKYLFFLIAFGIFLAPHAHAGSQAITFDASSTNTFSAVTVATGTCKVNSGSNELLVVDISAQTTEPTSVAVDGNAMTKAVGFVGQSKSDDIYYAVGLASGTHVVSATYSASRSGGIGCLSFFGVNQSTPLDAVASATTASATTITSTLTTTVADDVLVDNLAAPTLTSLSVKNANQVITYENIGTTNKTTASYLFATTTQAYTTGWSWSVTSALNYAVAAFEPVSTAVAKKFVERSCVVSD